jgi:hypothetical protein
VTREQACRAVMYMIHTDDFECRDVVEIGTGHLTETQWRCLKTCAMRVKEEANKLMDKWRCWEAV